MCESNVFINGELFMKDVARMEISNDSFKLIDILGNEKEIAKAELKEIDFVGHEIHLEK